LYQRVEIEQWKLKNLDTIYRKQGGENTRQGDCFYMRMNGPNARLLAFFVRIQL
jgi:hypothetical protein